MRYRWAYLGFNHSSCSTTCPTDRYVTPTVTTLHLALEFIKVYSGLSEHDLHSLIHKRVCSHSWKILSEFKCNCSNSHTDIMLHSSKHKYLYNDYKTQSNSDLCQIFIGKVSEHV